MDLKEIYDNIQKIDGHAYNTGAVIDKLKSCMLDIVVFLADKKKNDRPDI